MGLGRAWRLFKLNRLKNSSKRKGLLSGIRSAPKWAEHNRSLAKKMGRAGYREHQKGYNARADRIETDAAQARQELKNKRKQT